LIFQKKRILSDDCIFTVENFPAMLQMLYPSFSYAASGQKYALLLMQSKKNQLAQVSDNSIVIVSGEKISPRHFRIGA